MDFGTVTTWMQGHPFKGSAGVDTVERLRGPRAGLRRGETAFRTVLDLRSPTPPGD